MADPVSDPLPEPVFDALMARAGLTPSAAERASLLDASRHVVAITARLRIARGIEVEPATTFAPQEPSR
jgi:hypothetical protein